MKKLIVLGLIMCWGSIAEAQITVTNTFSTGQTITAAAMNTNFSDIGDGALDRTGGTISGNMAVDANVTIDGVDLSDYLAANGLSVTIGTGTAADTLVIYDGNAQDYYACLDDSVDDFILGLGSACGTTPALGVDESQDVRIYNSLISVQLAATNQGRLTLTNGTPATTSDVTDATSVYWNEYVGGTVGLYTGAVWILEEPGALTLSLSGFTASKPYDVFMDYNGGSIQLTSLVWTNGTTRATALARQDDIYVLTGDTQQRYLGTIFIDATGGETNDSLKLRHVWNYYNRVPRIMQVLEATNTWTYTTATWRQANASTANQLDFIIGVSEDFVTASAKANHTNSTGGEAGFVGIGLDSTTVSTGVSGAINGGGNNDEQAGVATYIGFPGIGKHTLVWLEASRAAGTSTWFGDFTNTLSTTGFTQSGIQGVIKG